MGFLDKLYLKSASIFKKKKTEVLSLTAMQKERYPLGMEDHTKILLSWVQTHRKISLPVQTNTGIGLRCPHLTVGSLPKLGCDSGHAWIY